ncbi:Predicted membrane protein [Saccharopolyspora antimicrobica]|uniref:Membrane protein DUF2207 n=1 Tax=Saccharopolyspora antimicrobica TaxID=455193 RepID=A0A1I5A690_9PSEU|nr:DUF2207 domain-containing protein [Saccharopolyspora antimicrobica]RKT83255.1 putative membrane protein DUF2207 [Saccharopolyspora antimicrobica]SFN57983.1 Predicted membrane protein [Saccharopolyspora antimicrobica]
MLTKRGLLIALTALLLGAPNAAAAQERPVDALPGEVASEVHLKLERDGLVSVTEQIVVPPGQPVSRTMPLRQSSGPGEDRVFTVSDASVSGGEVHVGADEVRMTLHPGISTLKYVVRGAVADAGDLQDVRWQVSGGWNVPVGRVEVSLLSPKVPQAIMCLAGPLGSEHRCDQFEISHTQEMRAMTYGLAPGDRMDITFQLPAGTVPATAVTEEYFSLAKAFSLTPGTGVGLAAIGLVLIGGLGLVWYARGRDVRAFGEDVGSVEVLMTDSRGGVTFASPDGVLPGQIGAVVDERVDPVDVTATVIDLAVRNYLWIEELPGQDWRIVRINPADDALRPFERAVHDLLVGEAAEVRLSQLRGLDLSGVRDALYADVVDKEWFARRPDADRNLFWWSGIGVAIGGAALTAALALTTSVALLGLGVVLGGVAMVASARLMPARTRRGSALVMQVRGLRGYLHEVSANSLPAADRETVFSRSLPYALVLGETDRWLAEFAELDPAADGTPGLYWYAAPQAANLQNFRRTFPQLTEKLNTTLKS